MESQKESRIHSITRLYYSKPDVQRAILDFAKGREVIPRYTESFGKRPDTLQYPADIINLVNKGATSFHASEELWLDPLLLKTEMKQSEILDLRDSWDLLIDIDSPYLDYSKIAAQLICDTLEKHGIKDYGIKFSGSKGFHIIVPAGAFPRSFGGKETKHMFPEWPRAILSYLKKEIKSQYNREIAKPGLNFEAVRERMKLSKEDITSIECPNCGKEAKKGTIAVLECERCRNTLEKPNLKITKRKLKCIDFSCPGSYMIKEEKDYYFCESCGFSSYNKKNDSGKKIIYSKEFREQKYSPDFKEEIAGEKLGSLDLVLVSPRHLFRMPYSLHEKTALASMVISKPQISTFIPKHADPLFIKPRSFYPVPVSGEATKLLENALKWKILNEEDSDKLQKKYDNYESRDLDIKGVPEELFPMPIKKLLKGLEDGKKRGLFVLLTFLKCLNFPQEYIISKIKDWNTLNTPPLREGYVKSQIDWHMRQRRKILPPNYTNESFYLDLGLCDSTYAKKAKNPLAEVIRMIRKQRE